jgi:uncharacterized protein YndB with AHSA1/START domain
MPDTKPGTERAVFKVVIKGTIDAVWREITKTDTIQQCMFNMRLHTSGLRVGAPIQMRSKSGKTTGIVGEVLEFEPPHRYKHTFKFTNMDDPPCTVAFDLKEVVGGVEFTMTIDDLVKGSKTSKQMIPGGQLITDNLKSLVETGRLPFKTKMIYTIIKLTEPLSPKICRAENWPLDRS